MHPIRTIATALALVLALPAAAVTVNPKVTVDAERVRLGDVFTDAGAAADVTIAAAPEPGREIVLRTFDLERLAAQHGLDWEPSATLRHVTVTRAGQTVPEALLRDVLTEALADRLGGSLAIDFYSRDLGLQVAAGELPDVVVDSLSLDGRSGRFEAVLSVGGRSLRLLGRATRLVEIPVLARDIAAGEVVGPDDTLWQEVAEDRVDRRALSDLGRIAGQAARRPMAAGRMLTPRDLEEPVVVIKGSMVTLALTAPGLQLSAAGRALEDGAQGATIQVMNVQSKRTVQAVVVGPQHVQVSAGAPIFQTSMTVTR